MDSLKSRSELLDDIKALIDSVEFIYREDIVICLIRLKNKKYFVGNAPCHGVMKAPVRAPRGKSEDFAYHDALLQIYKISENHAEYAACVQLAEEEKEEEPKNTSKPKRKWRL
ncbi:hypothetical protein [Zooshikella sp. RANM57]|uniref:hypothetical protein n=1 Tax=Zooshikella sp. RANM57 TaxID=3425863 RepID=UPI003D6FCAC9